MANLTIIELTMWPSGRVCVAGRVCGNRLLKRLMSLFQNRRLCSRPYSHESVIFFVFLAFMLFTLRSIKYC